MIHDDKKLCDKCIKNIQNITCESGGCIEICPDCSIKKVADYLSIYRREKNILIDEKQLMKHQLSLIEASSHLLENLLETTYTDCRYGRGFGSFYPEEALKSLKTMKYVIELELGICHVR